jgi:pseudaminic acid synthase
MAQISIGGRLVGDGAPVLCVAEIGGNHLGSWERVERMVHAAHEAGADAVKGQCFAPAYMTLDVDDDAHSVEWAGEKRWLHGLYAETWMPSPWHQRIKWLCDKLGMLYFASEFSPWDVAYMEELGAPCHKVASFEITDIPLIQEMARTGKPVIISCGMASSKEIDEAVDVFDYNGTGVILLKCTSAYPAPVADANIATMEDWWLNPGFLGEVGLSDHTRSNTVVSAAVALGACLVERHFTLSRADGGADAAFSDEPAEFAAMVRTVRDTEAALGSVRYGPTEAEKPMLRFRRSLWVVEDIAAGDKFTEDNIRSLRPVGGLEPRELPRILGRVAERDFKRGEPLLLGGKTRSR